MKTRKRSMGTTRSKYKKIATYLKNTCTSSGECLSFGKQVQPIIDFFDGFTKFTYVTGFLKTLDEESSNGVIHEVTYSRNQYTAHAVLKSSKTYKADNLLYEYLVGTQYINPKLQSFPCFIQTYGLYYYKGEKEYQFMNNQHISAKKLLEYALLPSTQIDYGRSCESSSLTSILIQHLHSTISIHDVVDTSNPISTLELHSIFFILYHALSSLATTFTHYDLHQANILLFIPDQKKCIQYVYHLKDGTTIRFKSKCVPKIIDYGRCYFKTAKLSSEDVYHKVCSNPRCEQCGKHQGYKTLNDPVPMFCSRYKNESADLRILNEHLLKKVNKLKKSTHSLYYLKRLLRRVQYGEGVDDSDKMYGTQEDLTLHPDGSIIANVTDAYHEFKKIMLMPDIQSENNSACKQLPVLGTLHVYDDKSMVYTI